MSFNIRWIAKIVADYTACVHFRHPNEVGGICFTFGLAMTVVHCLVATLGYKKAEGEGSLGEGSVRNLSLCFVASMVASFCMLLATMKKEFRRSFVETTTSNRFLQDVFIKEGLPDEQKIEVFTTNVYKWRDVIGEDVKHWVGERLPTWLEEKPEWFNEQKMSVIFDEYVEDKRLLARIRTRRVQDIRESMKRRRSSLGLGMGGVETMNEASRKIKVHPI